ncbi:MAG: integrase core domain-containing protein [Sedimentisphaerales bacterium]
MKNLVMLLFELIRLSFKNRHNLILENLLLRQQIIILKRKTKKPKLKNIDRIILIWISKLWNNWKSALIIVKPETLIGWHKKGFKFFWRWKSRRTGRPLIDWELIKFIRKLQKENITWTHQRIQGELAKLGYNICDNTVKKYMLKIKPDGSNRQSWLSFLINHAKHIAGIDLFVVRTIFFKAIYVFVAISHDRRKIMHFAITSNPCSQWVIQQLREAFAFDETTKYVIRDNDKIFSEDFKMHIKRFGLEDTPTTPHSPLQNPVCERAIGTLRRECLDHMIILNEKHLYNILNEYIYDYYNISRTHMSLDKDSPEHRPVQIKGRIVSKPILSGLHHVYSRVA